MRKVQAALWLGTTGALLGGCVPMQPNLQPSMYANYMPASNNGITPYLASYHPRPPNNGYSFFPQPEPADAPARRALLAEAHRTLGVRYKYGGRTPYEGFDCSGLMQFIYQNANGITLPRTAAEQSQVSRAIHFEQMRPGDLIFFRTSGNKINHVGIYTGRGEFIHAASGSARVVVDRLSRPYWQQRLVKFGRILA